MNKKNNHHCVYIYESEFQKLQFIRVSLMIKDSSKIRVANVFKRIIDFYIESNPDNLELKDLINA